MNQVLDNTQGDYDDSVRIKKKNTNYLNSDMALLTGSLKKVI